jgi:asparagine synthase (glutamine-hydrolysing)
LCGIAGIVDLLGRRKAPPGAIARMASALIHRGPDDDGFFEADGVALANRRLSIIGLADGKQPISNESGSANVVLNGELFDYIEKRAELQAQGHVFRTSTDVEIVPHLWEQHGEGFFDHLHGQFAFALYDGPTRRLILARDRIGIVPLFWSVVRDGSDEWLLFASEIKALLVSGMVKAEADPCGLNGIFTHFAMPGPRTCFAGIWSLPPGHWLDLRLGPDARGDRLKPRAYWKLDFPDKGQELDGPENKIVGRYEELLYQAVQRRLRADVPVVSYLSGGIDSSQVVAMAVKALGRSLPTFTIGVQAKGLNEEREAELVAKYVGCEQIVVPFDSQDVMAGYPELIRTAEMPVMDTSCAALLALAREVHRRGYKVALTGEGSDEFLAGYPWFKIFKLFEVFNKIPGLHLAHHVRRTATRLSGLPMYTWPELRRNEAAVGGYGPWNEVYGVMSLSRLLFFSDEMRQRVGDFNSFEDLGFDTARMANWHPFNRGLALGIRVMLPGMLLLCKGDRVAMHSSVETRYPFLDEDLMAYSTQLHPRWKLRRFRDKYVVRKAAENWLPKSIARRRKVMFRAPMDSFHLDNLPPYIDQLLSDESLKKTGYFDVAAVKSWRERLPGMSRIGFARTAVEMALATVTATQLWHQTFIDGSIADVPTSSGVNRLSAFGQNEAVNAAMLEAQTATHEAR